MIRSKEQAREFKELCEKIISRRPEVDTFISNIALHSERVLLYKMFNNTKKQIRFSKGWGVDFAFKGHAPEEIKAGACNIGPLWPSEKFEPGLRKKYINLVIEECNKVLNS